MFNATSANWAAVGRSLAAGGSLCGGAGNSAAADYLAPASFQWYGATTTGTAAGTLDAHRDRKSPISAADTQAASYSGAQDFVPHTPVSAGDTGGKPDDKPGISASSTTSSLNNAFFLPPTDFSTVVSSGASSMDLFYPRGAAATYSRAAAGAAGYFDGTAAAPSLYQTFDSWLSASSSSYGKSGAHPHPHHYAHHHPQYHQSSTLVNGQCGAAAAAAASSMFSAFPYGSLAGHHHHLPAALGAHHHQTTGFSQPSRPVVEPLYPWMKYTGTVNGQAKRTRQTYSRQQTLELEKEFYSSRYLTRKRRKEISQTLRLTERQVKIWFQNRRMKWKKENRDDNKNSCSFKNNATDDVE